MLMVSTARQTPSPCRRTRPLWPGSEAALAEAGHGPPAAADRRGAVPLGDSELRMDPGLRSRGERMRVEGDRRRGVGAARPGLRASQLRGSSPLSPARLTGEPSSGPHAS